MGTSQNECGKRLFNLRLLIEFTNFPLGAVLWIKCSRIIISFKCLIDANTNDSSLNRLYNAHGFYMLNDTTARGIIMDVVRNMKYWKNMAEDIGLSRREITYFTDRFKLGMEFQYGSELHRWDLIKLRRLSICYLFAYTA